LQAAVRRACQAGALFVAAAGNDARQMVDANRVGAYPAAFAGQPGMECVIAVASTDQTGALSSFSNFGSQTQIAAPGQLLQLPVCFV
jgi:subtilisin family serine protease